MHILVHKVLVYIWIKKKYIPSFEEIILFIKHIFNFLGALG